MGVRLQHHFNHTEWIKCLTWRVWSQILSSLFAVKVVRVWEMHLPAQCASRSGPSNARESYLQIQLTTRHYIHWTLNVEACQPVLHVAHCSLHSTQYDVVLQMWLKSITSWFHWTDFVICIWMHQFNLPFDVSPNRTHLFAYCTHMRSNFAGEQNARESFNFFRSWKLHDDFQSEILIYIRERKVHLWLYIERISLV